MLFMLPRCLNARGVIYVLYIYSQGPGYTGDIELVAVKTQIRHRWD